MRTKCQINVHLQSGRSCGKLPQFKSPTEVWEVKQRIQLLPQKGDWNEKSIYQKSFVYSPATANNKSWLKHKAKFAVNDR